MVRIPNVAAIPHWNLVAGTINDDNGLDIPLLEGCIDVALQGNRG